MKPWPFVAALTFAIGSCATGGLPRDVQQRAMAQCEADAQPRWLGPRPVVARLAILGEVRDPVVTGGEIILEAPFYRNVSNLLTDYMEGLDLDRIDVNLRPGSPRRGAFGPAAPDPGGFYAIERWPRGDPRCAAYEAAGEARRQFIDLTRFRPTILADQETCLSLRYLGEVDLGDYSHVVLHYRDQQARFDGYDRVVSELREGLSTPVARSVTYVIPGRITHCLSDPPFRAVSSLLLEAEADSPD